MCNFLWCWSWKFRRLETSARPATRLQINIKILSSSLRKLFIFSMKMNVKIIFLENLNNCLLNYITQIIFISFYHPTIIFHDFSSKFLLKLYKPRIKFCQIYFVVIIRYLRRATQYCCANLTIFTPLLATYPNEDKNAYKNIQRLDQL